MKAEINQALEELRRGFSDSEFLADAKPNGGAVVTIDPIDLGSGYSPRQTWIRFEIGYLYPYADIYPLFIRPDVARADGLPHGEGIAPASFEGEPALQLSRRSNHLDASSDTAILKVTKVIQWLKEQ